jgi:hypothetical protein
MNPSNRCSVLLIIIALAFPLQMFSQSRDENWTQCRDDNAAISLKGCNAVLNSGEEGPRGRFAALVNRGIAYRDLGLNAQAVADFTQAIALNGADVEILMERGATYGQDGEFGKAIQDYDSALDLEGENASALFARGVFKRLNGNLSGGDADIAAANRMDANIGALMADRGISEVNLRPPQTAETPAVVPDTVATVPPAIPVKTEPSTGYLLLLVSSVLILALVVFLLLRPVKSSRSAIETSSLKRSGAVTALGVMHLIGSALGLISIFGFVDIARRTSQMEKPIALAVAAVLFGICLLSIACGIGLLRLRAYSRRLQMGFAWVGLLAIPLGTVISILILYYLRKPEIKALFNNPVSPVEEGTAASPNTSSVRVRRVRLAAIITAFAALFLIGIVVGRHTGASTNHLEESQFAFGLLSSTGRDVESPYMTERDISDISVTSDSNQRAAVSISFTSEGASKMRTLTSKNIGRELVFVIDGSPDIAHPSRIESTVGGYASLSFASADDAYAYVSKLKASRDPGERYR